MVLLTNKDGSRPAQALASFDYELARIAVPLTFFSYKDTLPTPRCSSWSATPGRAGG